MENNAMIQFTGDPQRINWQANDHDQCAYCDAEIPEDTVALMLFADRANLHARFCDSCAATYFGVRSYDRGD